MKTDCRPNRFKKYHDRLDTHRTSRSRVITPDCSMDLNRSVSGNGSFTVRSTSFLSASLPHRPVSNMPDRKWDLVGKTY